MTLPLLFIAPAYLIKTHADRQDAYSNHLHTGYEPTLEAVSITESNKLHQQLMFDLSPFQNISPPFSATQYSFCQKSTLIILQPRVLVILFSLFQILLSLIFTISIIYIYLL